MNNEKKEDWALEQDLKYNRLTAFKLFAMTSSMVISVDELAPFGKTGATALFYLLIAGIAWFIPITQMAGEMASIDGWEKGGIFTWVKGSLGDKTGWTAMFYQWIHITVGMDTMMYVIIGALSITFGTPWFNTTPIVRFILMMVILWGATAIQVIGVRKIGRIAEWLFILGIATPVILLIISFFVYVIQGHPLHMTINWNTVIPHKLNGNTLVAFVPFMLAFCGGEASAPHVKNLDHIKSYSKVMLGLAVTAICFDLLGSMAIGMTVPKDQIENSTGFVYTYGKLLTSIGLPGDLLQKIVGIVITHKTPLDHEVISKTSRLKYIGIMGTGYDVVDIESAHRNKVVVTNIPTYASDAVAQFTFSLLLEVTTQVGLHNQLVHENRWAQAPDFTFLEKPLLELKGKTLGLIGYGHIAQKVAKIGHAFSMKVIFYNHRPKKITESWIQQVSFDELLKQSDVLSLHVIQTPETIDLINNDTIAKMKNGVIRTCLESYKGPNNLLQS